MKELVLHMSFLPSLQLFVQCQLDLLAQGRIQSLNQAFLSKDGKTTTALTMLAIAVLVTVTTALVYWVVKRRSEAVINQPRKLFAELCRAHRLSFGQRRLLANLARSLKLEDQCEIFVNSELWQLDPVQFPQLCKKSTVNQLRLLRRILFVEQPQVMTLA